MVEQASPYKGLKLDAYETHEYVGCIFDFGTALALLKAGATVARAGWNGKGMSLRMHPAINLTQGNTQLAYIEMTTVQGDYVPWLASQTDVIDEDWVLVNTAEIVPQSSA